jgi:hypothetical protein
MFDWKKRGVQFMGFQAMFLLLGCSPNANQSYFPIKPKSAWSYVYRSGLQSHVVQVEASRPLSVAGQQGWSLSGPGGESRVAWDRHLLYFQLMAGTSFIPALPILDAKNPKSNRAWRGTVLFQGSRTQATATIEQLPDRYKIGVRPYDSLKVTVYLRMPQTQIELMTWFAKDIGIIAQQQRTNNFLDVAYEYLSGPERGHN